VLNYHILLNLSLIILKIIFFNIFLKITLKLKISAFLGNPYDLASTFPPSIEGSLIGFGFIELLKLIKLNSGFFSFFEFKIVYRSNSVLISLSHLPSTQLFTYGLMQALN